jgi:hypothetical protein
VARHVRGRQDVLPAVRSRAGEPLAGQLLDKYVYSQPGHRWLKEGMTKEQLQKIQEFYRQRYGEQSEPKEKRAHWALARLTVD